MEVKQRPGREWSISGLSLQPAWTVFGDLGVGVLYLGTLVFLMTKYGSVDIKIHNQLLGEYLAAGAFPIPPGYYFLVYIVDWMVRIKYPFVASSVIVLAFAHWWKFRLTYFSVVGETPKLKQWAAFLLAFSFLFLSPVYIPSIDGPYWYLGKFSQTIWHNSTLICVFPLCLLLVAKTSDWLKTSHPVALAWMLLLGLGIALIKPSFLFCYIPALPVFVGLRDRRFSRKLLQTLGIVSFLFLILMIEKYLIYIWDPVLDRLYTEQEQSRVVFDPLKIWLHFSKEPVFDFLTSFPLLIGFLLLWHRRAFGSSMFVFSLLLLFFALLVYFLLAESGYREFHGNFYWQIPIALFVCNLSIVHQVVGDFVGRDKKIDGKFIVIFALYLIQVLYGLGYWARIFTSLALE